MNNNNNNNNYERYLGQVFDNRYRIDFLIGVGGMAAVFKAVDLLMRRNVAVKILRDDIAADDASVRRFINESKAVSMLSHPNIVNIYDVSVRDNVKYIVMEFIEGITLKKYMDHRKVLNTKETIGYTLQILRALNHAHQKGIVHRDIKPQNIMLLKDGVIKVMDFGIAKLPNAETVTMKDKAIGTVYYISPEQASGEEIDHRSDLYSLGVMMYEMTTGKLPFNADSPVSVALMQVNEEAASPRSLNPKIPVGLDQVITKAMEKNPTLRYQSAEQMISCLEKLKEDPNYVFKASFSEKLRYAFSKKDQAGRISKSTFPIILGVFTAFILTFCISGFYTFSNLFGNSSLNKYETVKVESYIGQNYDNSLLNTINASDYFRVLNVEYEYNSDIDSGVIIRQYPSAGEDKKVLAGKQFCELTLVVSGGESYFTLDDYYQRDYRLVVKELNAKHIHCIVEKSKDKVYQYGRIISTDPLPGAKLTYGDTVTIVISAATDKPEFKMIDFVGMNEAEALEKVLDSKLIVGSVTYEKSKKPAGTIIEQSVEKDEMVYQYSVVDFVVSGGKNYGEKVTETTEAPTTVETTEPVTETEEVTTIDTETATETETEIPTDTVIDTSDTISTEDPPETAETEEPETSDDEVIVVPPNNG